MNQVNDVLAIMVSISTLLLILVGVVAWNVRLEAKVKQLEKDHDGNVDSVWRKLDEVQSTVVSVLQSVARLEGKFDAERNGHLR
jgi:hypothetical protein